MSFLSFTHRLPNDEVVEVEAEVTYYEKLSFDANTADCRDDLHDDLEVIEIIVYDKKGNDVTEQVYISDEVLVKELLLQEEYNHYEAIEDLRGLGYHDLVYGGYDDEEY
ncbi:hypothetical protein VPHG_00074 [Vibrio phage 11895-B1]|uniref:hypothetical protein n=1 Tax=Vibrio phage 11895-B1 TaxID=754075 RepID=UPI0002C0AFBE|nr:hypothetical protein VPHG_00074 [Vibrio phage 11895-B1]AGH32141.1 hypothetical protein VPHG_00074 [Vibrio phage 11895-B1]